MNSRQILLACLAALTLNHHVIAAGPLEIDGDPGTVSVGLSPRGIPSVRTTNPTPPANLAGAGVSSSQINLSWTDNSSNETGFKVERSSVSAGPFTQIATTASTSFTDAGVIPSTTWYYRVRAYNTSGDSNYSNIAGATTMAGTPSAPGGLAASAASSSQINLSWTDNSSNESGFKVERAASSTGPWTQIVLTGASVTGFSDTALAPSSTWFYRLRATNAAGDSAYSNLSSATTGSGTSTGGALVWSKRFGGAFGGGDLTDPKAIATDAAGNSVTVGSFYGEMTDLGVVAGGGYDSFAVKFSPSNSLLWARRLNLLTGSQGNLSDYAYSVATDPAGNILVAGEFQGTADFGCGPHSNPTGNNLNAYVVKLAAGSGACLWSKAYGSIYRDAAYGVATDASGNVFVTGSFYDTSVDFGGVSLAAHFSLNAAPDIFILKLSGTDGHTVWAKGGFGSSSDDVGRAIAVDDAGNVLVTGEFILNADFGFPTSPLTNLDYPDVFVVKLDGSGSPLWARQYGTNLDQRGTDIAVDSANNVLITGWFRGSINFGGGTVTSPAGSSGLFLAKLSPAGAYMWQKTALDSDFLRYPSLAVDASDDVVMTSSIRQNVDFGGGALTTTNTFRQDAFVIKYRADGSYGWGKRFTGTNESSGCDVATIGSGLVFTGWLTGSVDFGAGPIINGTNGVRAAAAVKLGQ